jgi:hypothetical protein
LLLAFFSILESVVPSEVAISMVFSLADILSAKYLTEIARTDKWSVAAKYAPPVLPPGVGRTLLT